MALKLSIVTAGAIALAMMLSAPAKANWQYTKWGMSAEEAIKASSGKLDKAEPAPDQGGATLPAGARGMHQFGTAQHPVTLYFRNSGLEMVEIVTKTESSCRALRQEVEGEYGPPFASVSVGLLTRKTWKDSAKGNTVEFMSFTDVCSLTFTPLRSDGGSAL